MIYSANHKDILRGRITDVYFLRTRQILEHLGVDRSVRMEVFLKAFPHGYSWGVFAGLEEAVELLKGRDINLWALPEGTVFKAGQPLMQIEGKYLEFGIYETAILGFLCHSSGISTKAARCRLAAGDRMVLSFGGRRVHPAIAPQVERCAYIGGLDGASVVMSSELLNIPPSGTMPHALVLLLGDTIKAAMAYDDVIDKGVPRVALIDTLNDEKFEAIRLAESLGEGLDALRLDTPGSRRGNIRAILEEVRWELNLRGYNGIKLFLSGGLDESDLEELKDVVDGFGVGTAVSGSKVFDMSMDIVEIEGMPTAKRGKASGAKRLLRCPGCGGDIVIPWGMEVNEKCTCGGEFRDLMVPVLEGGKLLKELPSNQEIREYVLGQLREMDLGA